MNSRQYHQHAGTAVHSRSNTDSQFNMLLCKWNRQKVGNYRQLARPPQRSGSAGGDSRQLLSTYALVTFECWR